MHTYSVEFKVTGEFFEAQVISQTLGIQATSFYKKGEPKSPKRVWEQSVWTLAAQPGPNQLEWKSIEEGLAALLDRLLPLKAKIDKLKETYRVLICCGQFASGFGGGPSFSPALLKRLASLEVELTISTYWHSEATSAR
jgi:Domain of unknown function (DUF4279)